MARASFALLLVPLCLWPAAGQLPGGARPPAGQVSRIYWELQQTTEVLVRLEPGTPEGKPLPLSFTFHAFFPGRPERDWRTGEPQWPKGQPSRLVLTAQGFPMTVTTDLTLRLTIDGRLVDLTAPERTYRNVPCLFATEGCTPNGVEVEIDRAFLRSLVRAGSVRGQALGFPFQLTKADQAAIAAFAGRVGMS